MNNFREKMEQKSTEELKNIVVEIEDNYGDESLNNARKKALEMIKDILTKRGIDVEKLLEEKEQAQVQDVKEEAAGQQKEKQQDQEQNLEKQQEQEDDFYQQEDEIKAEDSKKQRYKTAWDKEEKSDVQKDVQQPETAEKYKALKYVPGFIKISSLIFFLLVIIFNIVYPITLLTSLMVVFIALIILIPYYAISEFIVLFLDLEEHARKTREVLEKFYDNA